MAVIRVLNSYAPTGVCVTRALLSRTGRERTEKLCDSTSPNGENATTRPPWPVCPGISAGPGARADEQVNKNQDGDKVIVTGVPTSNRGLGGGARWLGHSRRASLSDEEEPDLGRPVSSGSP